MRALEGDAPTVASGGDEQPRATELASQCPGAVSEMRRVLRRLGWTVPCERYAFEDDGPELMRCVILWPPQCSCLMLEQVGVSFP